MIQFEVTALVRVILTIIVTLAYMLAAGYTTGKLQYLVIFSMLIWAGFGIYYVLSWWL